ncbi:2-oxo acid dehydrogenase subunit E2 [Rhodococcus sp. AD45-ID]|uniref:dihydrolipoamide acetyltransferase family protein n=1 Tax=unclassified Rhodococcus (in: high G+C Gram-positive bacteria) TaxID=192944 RepID=UPI0005D443E2|nr:MULTISPECIES: dihydrolipoamide acetyltransferase family protein [unclassified Rhodococcus (in: high G+C Gram-positive bacteria)]KJF22613.1 Dihydrolipoyllysine-residue acetyltransferase component of pyruvate dehydrogenase complex [Rhodococcus sp. AD45]NRI64413.1 2-oxo acid dehydrogenase subunit E2 [Rhodococcus sp. MS16]PSR40211.1 2-oxo acid dehydrogenase subunit E2 [Rhodococcus sp. AD45-ID]
MFDFVLPSLGSDMEEGTLTDWLVKPGEEVERGQAVATVDTVKAAVDVEIWQKGTIYQLLIEPGTTVSVGTAMATLLAPGESAPDTAPEPKPLQDKAEPQRRIRVSPVARREAEKLGIDIASLEGTGPLSSVTLNDVLNAAHSRTSEPTEVVAADKAKEMRRAIAASMSRSKREIPHYYLTDHIPLEAAAAWLERENTGRPVTERLLAAVLQLKAVALAAQRFPEMNGFWQDGEFRTHKSVHVGVAISLRQGGLVAPAIHDTADKPLRQLMTELTDLVARARAGSMRSSEMSDPTLTVTNLGERSVEAVLGVIYPPQVALVGFGQIAERPWVDDGKLCVHKVVTSSLAADHRASDGHRGAQFLTAISELLQHPQDL